MPRLKANQRRQLLQIYEALKTINHDLNYCLENYLKYKSYRRQGRVFSREWFNHLDADVAQEVVATWLKTYSVPDYGRRQIAYIVNKLQTLTTGKRVVVSSDQEIVLTKRSLRLKL